MDQKKKEILNELNKEIYKIKKLYINLKESYERFDELVNEKFDEIVSSNEDFKDDTNFIKETFNKFYRINPNEKIKTSLVHRKIRSQYNEARPGKIKNILNQLGVKIKVLHGFEYYCISEKEVKFEE